MRTIRKALRFLWPSIFALLASAAFSETFENGEWSWTNDDDGSEMAIAATGNEANQYFGQVCYFEAGNCLFVLTLDTSCEEDAEHPALMSSDAGSVHVTLVCQGLSEGAYTYFVSPFDDVDYVVRKATRLAIVVPLDGDEFQVSRFSGIGAVETMDEMRTWANGKVTVPPKEKPPVERL